jgi:hypothetical protein
MIVIILLSKGHFIVRLNILPSVCYMDIYYGDIQADMVSFIYTYSTVRECDICGITIWAASRQNQHSAFAISMDPDQPAHPRSLIRIHAVRFQTLLQVDKLIANSRQTDSEQHGSWSNCAGAQAGLDPCWSQTHYVSFVMARLKLNIVILCYP